MAWHARFSREGFVRDATTALAQESAHDELLLRSSSFTTVSKEPCEEGCAEARDAVAERCEMIRRWYRKPRGRLACIAGV